MRARTHSFAFLPATSTLATIVLTVAWWMTMIGLAEPAAPHVGAALVSAAVGVAVVSVATHPHVRAAFAQWVLRHVTRAQGGPPPDVAHRWRHVARSVVGPRTYEVELLRVARPRAPGRDPTA